MLILPIKKQWFDMILSGEKKEEYREIKAYWTTRFRSAGLIMENGIPSAWAKPILFKNGYSKNAPTFIANCQLSKGYGRSEWGAEPDKEYYILHMCNIRHTEGWIKNIHQIKNADKGE